VNVNCHGSIWSTTYFGKSGQNDGNSVTESKTCAQPAKSCTKQGNNVTINGECQAPDVCQLMIAVIVMIVITARIYQT
jgi:hypothetical protein